MTILQSKHSVEYFLNTAWVIAITRGVVISCIMIVMGVAMERFYDQPQLLFLVGLASLIPLIKGFINPMIIVLHKNMAFFTDSLYRFSLLAVDALLSVLLVWTFNSVFAWIAALVGAALFEVIISFLFFTPKPKFEYSPHRAQLIFAQAKGLGLSSLLTYLTENVDNLLIGKIVGSFGLGIYQPAYGLSHELNYELAKSVHHGAFPVLSKITDDIDRTRRAFFRTLSTTIPLILALSAPFLFFPHLIVPIVFGDEWSSAIPLLPWLTLAGLLQALLMLCYSLLLAKKRLAPMNIQLGISFVVLVIGILWLGTTYGLLGAVLAVVISRLLTLPIVLYDVLRQLKIKLPLMKDSAHYV